MRRRAHRPPRPEEGFTLIEVLIALALISIAFVGILSAVAGMITAGAQNKTASNVSAAVRNVGTYLQSYASAPYVGCAANPLDSYNQDLPPTIAPTGYTASVTGVQFWRGDTPAGFDPACPAGGDQGLELVTVTVSSGTGHLGGQFSRSLDVLKRSTP